MAESASPRPLSSSESPVSSANTPTLISVGLNSAGTISQVNEKNTAQDKKEAKLWLDPEEYSLRKRLPPSLPKRNSDVYVTNKTHFKAQLNRCERLIDDGITIAEDTVACLKEGTSEKPVLLYLHSLGAAIPRALNLALQLQRRYGSRIQLDTTTSTVELTDDFEPIAFENPSSTAKAAITRTRHNSAVHIKISSCNSVVTSGIEADNGNTTTVLQEQ